MGDYFILIDVLALQFILLTKLKEIRYLKVQGARLLCWPIIMRVYDSVIPL